MGFSSWVGLILYGWNNESLAILLKIHCNRPEAEACFTPDYAELVTRTLRMYSIFFGILMLRIRPGGFVFATDTVWWKVLTQKFNVFHDGTRSQGCKPNFMQNAQIVCTYKSLLWKKISCANVRWTVLHCSVLISYWTKLPQKGLQVSILIWCMF